jgi:hypothetical protein
VASCFIVPRIFTLDDNRRLGFVVKSRAPLEYAFGIWEPASARIYSIEVKAIISQNSSFEILIFD